MISVEKHLKYRHRKVEIKSEEKIERIIRLFCINIGKEILSDKSKNY